MQHTTQSRKLKDFYKNLDQIIPRDLRKTIFQLEENPTWLDIGNYLISTPARENVDRLKLIDEVSAKTRKDYYEISDALKNLEKEGHIRVRRSSKLDHFMTPHFAEALRIRGKIEAEFLNPMVEVLGKDPEFKECKDLGKAIKRALYSSLL